MNSNVANLLFLAFANPLQVPEFADQYEARGRILLPYAEIDEPFTAYFDGKANKSRIDYYGDLELTVQRPDLQQAYKIAYMTTTSTQQGEKARRVCFNMAGSSLDPTTVQSVLPDLSGFQSKGKVVCKSASSKLQIEKNVQCEVWEMRNVIEQKENKYVFLLRRDETTNHAIPVYYLMMGYDSLLGSHYDKYEVIYESFKPGQINSNVFDVYNHFTCQGFPGPGHEAAMNPMAEFIGHKRAHIDDDFDKFVAHHGKNYDNNTELNQRKMNFLHNYRFINSINRKNLGFKLAVNHMTDFFEGEMKRLRGLLPKDSKRFNGGLHFDKRKYSISSLPTDWDWRLLGAVTPVKDQAICGSCWSFGTTGTIEGVYFVKTGKLVKLSQQQLIDCSWTEDNNGCDGGEDFRSYEYIMKTGGLATEEDYGHYLGVDGKCHDQQVKKTIQLQGFYNVTKGDAEALRVALFNHGPVTIAINASLKTFSFYSNGIYYDKACDPNNLDHQVLAVGYGELNGEKYWLVKNSWSTYWGNDGYVLISAKDNNCGVLSDATFPKL